MCLIWQYIEQNRSLNVPVMLRVPEYPNIAVKLERKFDLINGLALTKINDLSEMSTLGLAHVGDAVFELMVRTWLCTNGVHTAKNLHGAAVALVSAKAQADAAELIFPMLCESEAAIFKRGRNASTNSSPKSCSGREYQAATALEALFGYLYLKCEFNRLNELFGKVVE